MGITLGRDDLTDGALSVVQPQEAALPAFFRFAQTVQHHGALRTAITEVCLQPEADALQPLLAEAELPPVLNQKIHSHARALVESQRTKHQAGGIKALISAYSLSSHEGVALMCLAEALLRIPDGPTRDALIRDKLSTGDWQAHLGQSQSLFVNAATWGLLVSGRIVAAASEEALGSALARLAAKGGGPLIQRGISLAMRMMGSHFVSGRSIEEALKNARRFEIQGFRFSYDMLGEASTTAADAQRYYDDYFRAIHAIGKVAGGRGIYEGPGISIKLSALHPRYSRANLERVRVELHPRVVALARLARRYDIGLNIDAEEADRLEISLDVLECICADTELAGWNGIGFVVQAYQKRAPAVVDYLVDLGRRTSHRLMVRLVKGAYWDSEIKRAQIDGLEGFPVYTRKVHTDVSYLACARRLLAASDAVFSQFATHNAHTLASIYAMAGQNFYLGQYEFQCLHGMGEPLYQEIVGRGAQSRPCRIYAPVGAHETLLAYMVRRLLENGANSSFVNRIADSTITIDELIASPVEAARGGLCSPHPKISLPRDILGTRSNSAGVDLSNERNLAALSQELLASNSVSYRAAPMPCPPGAVSALELVRNPANRNDVVGAVTLSSLETVHTAVNRSVSADGIWRCCPAKQRAQILRRAANVLEERMPALLALIVREAGKSLTNAVAEVREGIDFLRYYAEQIGTDFSNETHHPLGPVACISPWNFPLAIFLGQVSAALAAGNTVLAKPAEETPLIAAQIVQLLWEAGVPDDVLQLLPGDGEIGAALVSDARVRGVIFTGSTAVARLISRTLAQRLNPDGKPVPLIAETGGINAMVVDSSALAEQVVGDVLVSAFDSAGQRCSALRLLCLQDEIADHVLTMLKGAMAELATGNPDKLGVDVGPVITLSAQRSILDYVQNMRDRQCGVHQCPPLGETANGIFVPPTLIEISHVSELAEEVFGPVLHVVRYKRDGLDALIDGINAFGYGLTFGLQSRIEETVVHVTKRINAGNIYVNRNMIGAAVGVQPFGGSGLSGTGPKAGGPFYVARLLAGQPARTAMTTQGVHSKAWTYARWLAEQGHSEAASRCRAYISRSPVGISQDMAGPVGERNIYSLQPRGTVRCVAQTTFGLLVQMAAVLATGNRAAVDYPADPRALLNGLPDELKSAICVYDAAQAVEAILFEGDPDQLSILAQHEAEQPGAIRPIHSVTGRRLRAGSDDYCLDWLVKERAISVNTAAAGGNVSLMGIG